MSAHAQRSNQVGSGTNSPPLGEDKPMGQASVDSSIDAGHVSDREQRKEYFGGSDDKPAAKDGKAERKMGQSMAATMEERGH